MSDGTSSAARSASVHAIAHSRPHDTRVLVAAVHVAPAMFLALGVDDRDAVRGGQPVVAGAVLRQGQEVFMGTCQVELMGEPDWLELRARSCALTLAAADRSIHLDVTVRHQGAITALPLAQARVAVPELAAYADRALILASNVRRAEACDALLNACLEQAFACGPLHGLCAPSCYQQHRRCERGCDC